MGGYGRTLLFTPRGGCVLTWYSLLLLLQCKPHLTSGVLADPAKIDEEFPKAWLPYFCLWAKGSQP